MPDILFYHLTETPLEHALPPLLEKSLERGWRVRVRGQERGRLEFLDRHLWTYRDDSFLPHGREGADQPILLTDAEGNANEAQVLMLIDGAMEPDTALAAHERVCVFFDGNDDAAVARARSQWKALSGTGRDCKYWAQDGGRWVQKA